MQNEVRLSNVDWLTDPVDWEPAQFGPAVEAPGVRVAVAMNQHTPPDMLSRLSKDPCDLVREAVAMNKSCPDKDQVATGF